jgi:hypothetical protein
VAEKVESNVTRLKKRSADDPEPSSKLCVRFEMIQKCSEKWQKLIDFVNVLIRARTPEVCGLSTEEKKEKKKGAELWNDDLVDCKAFVAAAKLYSIRL